MTNSVDLRLYEDRSLLIAPDHVRWNSPMMQIGLVAVRHQVDRGIRLELHRQIRFGLDVVNYVRHEVEWATLLPWATVGVPKSEVLSIGRLGSLFSAEIIR